MRYTSGLVRCAASFGVGMIAVMSLSAPASAMDDMAGPTSKGLDRGSASSGIDVPPPGDGRLDDPAVRQELNLIGVRPADGTKTPSSGAIDDPAVREELNRIDSPAPAQAPVATATERVLVDDGALELAQIGLGVLAGGALGALVGVGALSLRHRHHGLQNV